MITEIDKSRQTEDGIAGIEDEHLTPRYWDTNTKDTRKLNEP